MRWINVALTWPALLGALIRRQALTPDEAAWAMDEIMDGAASSAQIAAFGIALRMKGETVGEMTGLAQAMLRHATPIDVPGPIVDLVGTGGDGAHTVNISTMGAIVAAAAGARVVKHGNRAASSSCGSADVLEALGVVISLPPAASARLAEEIGIAFLFAPLYHPALRHTAAARSELRVPMVFNSLGPVANPARPGSQAVGVSDPRMGEVIAGVLAGRGCSALVFHGDDGLDELTPTTTSTVWVVHGETVAATTFDPATLGLSRARWRTCAAGMPAPTPLPPGSCSAGRGGRSGTLCSSTPALPSRPPRVCPAPSSWARLSPSGSPAPPPPWTAGPPPSCWTGGWPPASGSQPGGQRAGWPARRGAACPAADLPGRDLPGPAARRAGAGAGRAPGPGPPGGAVSPLGSRGRKRTPDHAASTHGTRCASGCPTPATRFSVPGMTSARSSWRVPGPARPGRIPRSPSTPR